MARKLIIDTDPGIDDAMAILAAFNSPELDVLGLTTIYGNVRTPTATHNAILLRELARREDVAVAQGASTSLAGLEKERIADFVHGTDGFGNTSQRPAQGKAEAMTAAEFIVQSVRAAPGEVTVLALGPLTNIALACRADPETMAQLGRLVVLGGAFFTNGNVNPAAEANIFGDPEAADLVFGQPLNIAVVGLDVTHRCEFRAADLAALRGAGRFGTFLEQITQFYLQYHRDAYGMEAVYVHDPTALAAVLDPALFTWRAGAARVVLEGVARGATIMDANLKQWNAPNGWTGRTRLQVAVGVQAEAVVSMLLQRMSQ